MQHIFEAKSYNILLHVRLTEQYWAKGNDVQLSAHDTTYRMVWLLIYTPYCGRACYLNSIGAKGYIIVLYWARDLPP
jgi:hypothetical protein